MFKGVYKAEKLILKDRTLENVFIRFCEGFIVIQNKVDIDNDTLNFINTNSVLEIKGVDRIRFSDDRSQVHYYSANNFF